MLNITTIAVQPPPIGGLDLISAKVQRTRHVHSGTTYVPQCYTVAVSNAAVLCMHLCTSQNMSLSATQWPCQTLLLLCMHLCTSRWQGACITAVSVRVSSTAGCPCFLDRAPAPGYDWGLRCAASLCCAALDAGAAAGVDRQVRITHVLGFVHSTGLHPTWCHSSSPAPVFILPCVRCAGACARRARRGARVRAPTYSVRTSTML